MRRVQDFADAAKNGAEEKSVREAFQLYESDSTLHRTPDGGRSVAGSTLAHDVRVAGWDGTPSNDPRGEVLIGTAGVIGVRLPPLQSIPISRNDTFVWNPATRGAVTDATYSQIIADRPGGILDEVRYVGDRAAEGTVACDFAAEMPPYPKLNEPAELVVRISREEIELLQTGVAKKATVEVKVSDPITLVVVPRRNCSLAPGESSARREVAVPAVGSPVEERFKLVGSAEGLAEILVEAWQSGLALIMLILEPVFVVDKPKLQYSARIGLFASPRTDDRLVLRIYEMRSGGQTRLKFIADSHTLSLNVDADSDDLGDIKRFVEDQYKALERAIPRTTTADYGKAEGRLRAAGNELWTRVVPQAVRKELWDKRKRMDAIQVISEEPFIPWEIAVMSEVGEAMENDAPFLSELGLTRWVTRAPWPGPNFKLGTGTFYYIAPDYQDDAYKLSGIAAEIKELERLFAGKAARVRARSDEVLGVLRAPPSAPDALHFICHGETTSDATWNAELLLEGDVHEGEPYEPETLAATQVRTQAKLRDEQGPGPIVFLNACRVGRRGRGLSGVGGFADAFLRPTSGRGASVFVGPMWNVKDETAVLFASKFYEQLLKPDIVLVQAVKSARTAAKAMKDPTWLAYSVYGDPFSRRAGDDA